MGDVLKMKPPPGAAMLYLPECPVKACAKCGAEDGGWIDLRIGCGRCAPELEAVSLEMAGLSSRVELLESALRAIHRKVQPVGMSVAARDVERIVEDHALGSVLRHGTDGG